MKKDDKWLYIIVAWLLLGSGGYAAYSMTRGLRNNNPGNIRRSPEQWVGLASDQTDKEFFRFISPEYGIRAMVKLLNNYYNLYGLRTVRQIISRWAPPIENDTDSYVYFVADKLNVDPDEPLALSYHMPALVQAITQKENGIQPYSINTIRQGIALAA